MSEPTSLGELARLFLKLGTIAFGGPAAHVAMMEDEVVRRRKWLTHEQFLDYVGATNIIPGPNSTELAIHIGHARTGWPGLFVAGICFILPASLIVGALAWAYVCFGTLPQVAGFLYGVKPIVIAVVVQALWRLGRTALKTSKLIALGSAAVILAALGVNELVILGVTGLCAILIRSREVDDDHDTAARALGLGFPNVISGYPQMMRIADMSMSAATGVTTAIGSASFGLWPLFGIFLKIGAVLFGSGYVLLAFLRADFVERLGWLTERQLMDAVAIGQVTPGPVFTTATFIGYVLGGSTGAIVATVAIFLPAFFFVALSGLVLPRIRQSPTLGAMLDGVNVASLALMAVVTWQLGRVAIVDPLTSGLAVGSAILLFRLRLNSAWFVLVGGAVGLLVTHWKW